MWSFTDKIDWVIFGFAPKFVYGHLTVVINRISAHGAHPFGLLTASADYAGIKDAAWSHQKKSDTPRTMTVA